MVSVHLNISGTKEQVKEPVLWRLGHDFNVAVNILKAHIEEDFGWAFIELKGPIAEIQRATAWLHTTGVTVDPVERSVFA